MEIDFNKYWLPSNITNGRIDIISNNNNEIKEKDPILTENNINSISRNLEYNLLSRSFFSKDNINKIQKKIIVGVYEKSNKKYSISNQSERELLIIMRSYYLQYGKNLDTNINQQIEYLNNLVINWSIDEILKNIEQYIAYKITCSTLPMPMERSQLSSQKGTKTLEIKSFI
jgi:hypothetical protein